jgi:secretion/DNA translocation related CpaE-like protein
MAEDRRIVAVTAVPALRATVERLAALTGAEAEVVTASAGVRARWRSAGLVVIGSDLAAVVGQARLPRRPGVGVVSSAAPDDALWRATVELGAVGLIRLPDEERSLVDLMGRATDASPADGTVIAVVGACGGAGASTLAAALACTSARGDPTLVVDGDPLGGGIDVLLGAEQARGVRWPEFAGTRGRLPTAALRDAVPAIDGLAVLSWDRSGPGRLEPEASAAVMDAAVRSYRRVIVDQPRWLPGCSSGIVAGADVGVLLVPATVRATVAASLVAAAMELPTKPLLVVRDPGAGRLSCREVGSALGLPVVATLRTESAVEAAARRGDPPLRRARGSLAQVCRTVLAAADATQQ